MMRHDILHVDAIPRERKALAAMIGEARYQRRKARIMNTISIIVFLVACGILYATFGLSGAESAPAAYLLTLPAVIR